MENANNDPRASNVCKSGFCCHFVSGNIRTPKLCMLNRECFHCAYDQWLEHDEMARVGAITGAAAANPFACAA